MSTSINSEVDPVSSSFEIRDHLRSVNPKSDVIGANHNSPAPTSTPELNDGSQKDDPATMAASEELKHTTISDKAPIANESISEAPPKEVSNEDKDMSGTDKDTTPEAEPTDAQDEEMMERLSSPKKKRGRDQDDETHLLDEEIAKTSGGEGNNLNGSRTMRTGPEKKRPRDTSQEPSRLKGKDIVLKEISTTETSKSAISAAEATKLSPEISAKSIFGSSTSDKFSGSGFGALAAASTSPFGSLGASKPSVFAGNTQPSVSGFGALAAAKAPGPSSTTQSGGKASLGFGGSFGAPTSGFGSLGSGSVFGGSLGNGFAGGSGTKLSSFAAPGKENTISGKPAKPFGAPESDEDEDEDDQDDSEDGADADDEETEKTAIDDKKKFKTSKAPIDDGEAEEATILQVRAKLFALGSKEIGWKERGVGTLKINAPKACVDTDESGHAIPGSFDSSMLENRSVRLIMRQENTHRVVLNTVVLKAMEFKPKPSTTPPQILFTAFEGESESKPINMLLKMSEANYKLFTNEIESIQHEL